MGEPGIEPGYHLLPTAMPGGTFLALLCRFIALNNDATPLHNPARHCLALPLLRVTSHSHCLTLTMLRLTMLCFAVALQDCAVPCLCQALLIIAVLYRAFAGHCRTLPLPCSSLLRLCHSSLQLASPWLCVSSLRKALALRICTRLCLCFAILDYAVPRLCFAIHD